MADDDWGLCADLQEKSLTALNNLKIDGETQIPLPVPASEYSPQQDQNEDDDEPEPNPGDISLMQKLVRTHLVETTADPEIQKKDPNSPLYSVKSFEDINLRPEMLKGVYGMGYNSPSKIQEKALPILIADSPQNLIAQSQSGKADLEIQKKDPNSPLYSVKSFEDLNLRPELLKGVYGMGFNSPSKIQETALPILIADPPQNLIAQSQSGTGKTAAFILSALSRVDPNLHYPHVLVLSPTYELAMQTVIVAKKLAQYCPNIKFRFAIRGENLERGHHITEQFLIGTPGKVFDWAVRFRFFDLKKIRVFVLHEADLMVSTQGHEDQSIRIHKQLSKDCQMMLFSATYSDDVMNFAEHIVPNPIIIRLKKEEESLDNIKQYYIVCKSPEEKFEALCNVYGTVSIGQAMIFCHTKKTAAWLVERMSKEGHDVALLSGELAVEQRIAVLNRFREGKEKVLIATNVCVRGIRVEEVTVVINFDFPVNQKGEADCETYVRRIGITGRFGKTGLVINMVDGSKSMAILKQIENHFGKRIVKMDSNEVADLEKMARR